jgi:DNA-directed RNA polymerase subunit RPC12/RpoP
MGWYSDDSKLCPNCGKKNAVTQFHNDFHGPLYLACPDCGLRMYCQETAYLISNTYIDKSIIGKDPEEDSEFEDLMDTTDETKNEKVINHIYY